MSIFDMFRTPEPAVAPQQPTAPNQTQAQPAAPTASGMGQSNTPEGKMAGTEQTPANPLDLYAKLYDDAAKAIPNAPPALKISPEVLSNVAQGQDFTQGVNQELIAKATSGDANAMVQLMNAVGQNAYRAAMDHNTALTDAYLGQRQSYDRNQVAAGVRQQLTQAELANTPNYSHPVVKNELNRVASALARANPESSPAEIAKAANAYIQQLSQALNPVTPTAPNKNGVPPGEMDWTAYLSNTPA